MFDSACKVDQSPIIIAVRMGHCQGLVFRSSRATTPQGGQTLGGFKVRSES